jgi:hypothetical protein
MLAYKLLTKRKDGSLGPLFINRKARIPFNVWLEAEEHPTRGYAFRPGWHCTRKPTAPHLSEKGRVWAKVEIEDFVEVKRPLNQGGVWYLANKIRVVELVN